MPIRFSVDGREYVCDTPEEAVALESLLTHRHQQRKQDRKGAPKRTPTLAIAVAPSVQPRLSEVLPLHKGPLSILQILATAPEGLTSDGLAARMSVGPKSLPPLFAHLNAQLTQMGYELGNVVQRGTVYTRGRGKTLYKLTDLGKEIAARVAA